MLPVMDADRHTGAGSHSMPCRLLGIVNPLDTACNQGCRSRDHPL